MKLIYDSTKQIFSTLYPKIATELLFHKRVSYPTEQKTYLFGTKWKPNSEGASYAWVRPRQKLGCVWYLDAAKTRVNTVNLTPDSHKPVDLALRHEAEKHNS